MEPTEELILDSKSVADLLELDGGKGKFLAELVEAYYLESPDRIIQIERSLIAGDVQGVARAAHALSGSSANVGAKRLREVAHRLEKAANAGTLAGAREMLTEIKSDYEATKSAFANLKKK